MTTANGSHTTPVTGTGQRAGENSLGEVIAVLRREALEAGAGGGRPVSRVRVSAGDITLEIDWTTPAIPGARDGSVATGPAVPAPDPAALGAPTGSGHADLAQAAAAPRPRESADDALAYVVPAHTVGVFYHSPEPGADPFVRAGDTVVAGQQVGIIEAMKLMIPVEADRGGVVREVLVADATPVEYGQPLLTLDVDAPTGGR
ncbi:acetyl-CoA carboxylase biotin carboxyl carrier protein subunit [Frankia sp. CcI49]|uniref:acetyl-CoA carboxylase biotin carboxyl carrier protein n=1 Tax=Frankia sp. CcI49 TaxID=1745382 RepID=UPI0009767A4E|nr:biotin/lipoyl-containing protein [Frankia sp. CcI49]ONH61880.1 acetyl-CoA carboxylase biotin carboxyl carrier protein subunit [Frankia sp. CcI49]